ncbi:MAG: conjugal transfer protein [Candidatus Accumulibacter sp.]|nr:conjugal transfer protein [Accumulibacter sp.]
MSHQESAKKAGISLPAFCKKVCLGSPVPNMERIEARMDLRRLKGDLSRLGGLVKQTLAECADRVLVHRLLRDLDARPKEVRAALEKI